MRESIPFERPSRLYLAWLAGFWEGEGSVLFKNGWRVTIAQKEKAILEEVAAKTDGKVYFQASSNSHRVYWYGARALVFLDLIGPYVRSDYRKRQIEKFRCLAKLARPKGRPIGSRNKLKML